MSKRMWRYKVLISLILIYDWTFIVVDSICKITIALLLVLHNCFICYCFIYFHSVCFFFFLTSQERYKAFLLFGSTRNDKHFCKPFEVHPNENSRLCVVLLNQVFVLGFIYLRFKQFYMASFVCFYFNVWVRSLTSSAFEK